MWWRLQIWPQARAEVVRGDRLADRADVVALALDREQHGAPDRGRIDLLAVQLELAERQAMLLEHSPHRLYVKLRGQIEHGEIFVVERLGRRRLFHVISAWACAMSLMRLHVALEVHAHEGGELDEARIDPAARAGVAHAGTVGDQVVLEPVDRLRLGQLVDLGRIDPGVDRPGHQGHAARLRRIAVLRHHGGGGEHGDAGLAHRDDMRARAHRLQEFDDVLDIFVEAEPPSASGTSRALCQSVM